MLKNILFSFFLIFIISGCSEDPSMQSLVGKTMGTTYNIKYFSSNQNKEKIHQSVKELLKEFDQELSNWNQSSWVTKFNEAPENTAIHIPSHAKNVIELCLELNKKSSGAFDITLSPLIEAWGFGYNQEKRVPPTSEIKKILSKIGSDKLNLSSAKSTLSKQNKQTQINCSAVAKGYGVDLVADLLAKKFNIKNYLVEIGGEIRCTQHPSNEFWRIGIPVPSTQGKMGFQNIVKIKNQAMATSGDYNNFFNYKGDTYQHILNPKTGRPVAHNLCSVSILAPNCALADGLATTCLVLGKDKGLEFLKQFPNCSGYFVIRESEGKFKSFYSPSFPKG